ncbi:MAG: hypothetical protein JO295_02185 [Verrucomicrobia bacterium]|nr:hypothetical protein [Verrucomicrobiota bacterium]
MNRYYLQLEAGGYAQRASVELKQQRYLSAALYAEALARLHADSPLLQTLLPELRKAFPTPFCTLRSPSQRVEHVIFGSAGDELYAAGGDGALYHWKLAAADAAPDRYPIARKPLSRLAWTQRSTSERLLLIAAWDATITVWDASSRQSVGKLAAHFKRTRITGLASDPALARFATAGDDGYAKLWNLTDLPLTPQAAAAPAESVPFLELTEHDDLAKAVAFSPDGTRVASGGFDGTIRIRSLGTEQSSRVIKAGDALNAVIFSPDGKLVLAAGRAGGVQAFAVDGAGDNPVWKLAAHANRINDLGLSCDGKSFFTASDDGSLRLWSLADQSLEITIETGGMIPGQKSEVKFLGLAVAPDGRMVAGSQSDGTVSVWSTAQPAAATFAELQPFLARRVPVRWERGSLLPRAP